MTSAISSLVSILDVVNMKSTSDVFYSKTLIYLCNKSPYLTYWCHIIWGTFLNMIRKVEIGSNG